MYCAPCNSLACRHVTDPTHLSKSIESAVRYIADASQQLEALKKTRKFRKLPVEISAFQTQDAMDIMTLEGIMHASPGDWIITGVKGETYPCKDEIFQLTYEPVEL
jgi:hypothetical protein